MFLQLNNLQSEARIGMRDHVTKALTQALKYERKGVNADTIIRFPNRMRFFLLIKRKYFAVSVSFELKQSLENILLML